MSHSMMPGYVTGFVRPQHLVTGRHYVHLPSPRTE